MGDSYAEGLIGDIVFCRIASVVGLSMGLFWQVFAR